MRWTHAGVYSGFGQAHDAEASGCPMDPNQGGVALRPLTRYFRDGFWVKYSQLETASGQASEAVALDNAKNTYGTLCEAPFSMYTSISSADEFYCSKLVWRIYNDNLTYPTNVNSNHPLYFGWLHHKYGNLAFLIILYVVAPDEIALDIDLDHYYAALVDIT